MSKFITIRNLPGNISCNNGLAEHLFHIFLVTQVSGSVTFDTARIDSWLSWDSAKVEVPWRVKGGRIKHYNLSLSNENTKVLNLCPMALPK